MKEKSPMKQLHLGIGQRFRGYFFIFFAFGCFDRNAIFPMIAIEHGKLMSIGSIMNLSSEPNADFIPADGFFCIGSTKKAQSFPMHGSKLFKGHFLSDIVFSYFTFNAKLTCTAGGRRFKVGRLSVLGGATCWVT